MYTDNLKEQLRVKTIQYGDFEFKDNIWYCSKVHKNAARKIEYTINFESVPNNLVHLMKYYALIVDNAIFTINSKVQDICIFINYLSEKFPDYKVGNVNRRIINSFENYLKIEVDSEGSRSKIYGAIMDFFYKMSDFPEMPSLVPTKRKNPFIQPKNKNPEKYIPEFVVNQLDKVMKDENNGIPLQIRGVYWLLRSFPNRITEVASMDNNCIKPLYSYYVLNIPTWKQNGGYIIEEVKTIPVLNTGHGKYVIDLIQRVQKQTNDNLKEYSVEERNKKYLFLLPKNLMLVNEGNKISPYSPVITNKEINKILSANPQANTRKVCQELTNVGINITEDTVRSYMKGKRKYDTKLTSLDGNRINHYLDRIMKIFGIKGESGEEISVSTHQFRHNATTDRGYIGGYTIDQLRTIRNDKGERMPLQYTHQIKEQHKAQWLEATGLTSPEKSPVEFSGVIRNLSDKKVLKRYEKNPQAYLVWEANGQKGVGFCSSISSCNPSGTSVHFECYSCNWFVPKADYYEDYKAELNYWTNIMEREGDKPNRAAHFENAVRNVNCLERIVEICKNGISKHLKDMEEKVNLGEIKNEV